MSKQYQSPIVVAITLIILIAGIIGVVAIYLLQDDSPAEKTEQYVEGWVSDAYIWKTVEISNKPTEIWNITLRENFDSEDESKHLIFFINNLTGPPIDVHICCYFDVYEYVEDQTKIICYEVYRVKSL